MHTVARAWKTELAPTQTQRAMLGRCAGATRYVWNRALAERMEAWEQRQESLRAMRQNLHITEWKRTDAPWLSDVPLAPLQETLRQLDGAYQAFFRRCKSGDKPGHPRFHSRGHGGSFALRGNVTISEDRIAVPWARGQALGALRLKERGYLPVGRFTRDTDNWCGSVRVQSVTISERAGRWFVSVQGEERVDEPTRRPDGILGVHLGVRVLATASDGRRWENPEHLAAMLRKLARLQRTVSRRKPKPGQRGSNRYGDAKDRVARLHYRIACARQTALHQVSHEIIASSPSVVVLDGWDVADMLEGSECGTDLSRRVADTSMGELRRQLCYKGEWNGIEVRVTEKAFPVTRTCSECGWVRPSELSGHEFVCGACGYRADREDNSARNLVRYAAGKPSEAQNARGEDAA